MKIYGLMNCPKCGGLVQKIKKTCKMKCIKCLSVFKMNDYFVSDEEAVNCFCKEIKERQVEG